jgi:hypothetical protein
VSVGVARVSSVFPAGAARVERRRPAALRGAWSLKEPIVGLCFAIAMPCEGRGLSKNQSWGSALQLRCPSLVGSAAALRPPCGGLPVASPSRVCVYRSMVVRHSAWDAEAGPHRTCKRRTSWRSSRRCRPRRWTRCRPKKKSARRRPRPACANTRRRYVNPPTQVYVNLLGCMLTYSGVC